MSSNRRRFSRIPLDLDAVLVTDSHRYTCRVRNFCSGGLLLECGSALSQWTAGTPVHIEVLLDGNAAEGVLPFNFEIRHVNLPFIGGAFVRAPFQQVLRLSRRAQEESSTSSGHADAGKASPGRRVVEQLNEFADNFLGGLETALATAFRVGCEGLKKALDNTPDVAKRKQKNNIQRLVSRNCDVIVKIAVRQVTDDLTEFVRQPDDALGQQRPPLDQLALIDRGEFESWLVANIATRAAEAEIGLSLEKLNGFMSQALSRPVRSEQNPVAPAAIIKTLQRVLMEDGLNNSDLSTWYRYFGPALHAELKGLYEDSMWHVKPVMPLVKAVTEHGQVSRKDALTSVAGGGAVGGSAGQEATAAGAAESPVLPTANVDTFQTLRSLIELQSGVHKEKRQMPDNWQVFEGGKGLGAYSLEDLDIALDRLSQAQVQSAEAGVDLKQEILKSLQGSGVGNVSRNLPSPEDEVIEVVERLFHAIEDNSIIASAIKDAVLRLKYVVLRVSLKDLSFLSNALHPARQFLNQLGGLTGRISGVNLTRLLDTFVGKVIDQYSSDMNLFSSLAAQLSEIIARQETTLKRSAERIAKAAQARHTLAAARVRTSSDIRQRLLDHRLPKIIIQLLYDAGWRQLLLVSLLKQEEKYREVLGILDLLLKHPIAPLMSTQDNRRADAKMLLPMVQAELAKAGQSSLTRQVMDGLKAWLLDGKPQETLVVTDALLESWETSHQPDTDLLAPKGVVETSLRRGRLAELRIGAWLMYSEFGQTPLYLYLAWCDDRRFLFTYFDEQGVQERGMDTRELWDRLDRGQMRVITKDDLALVDRGLFQVVHAVYEDVAHRVVQDPLTGLPNRHEFERQLERFLARTKNDGSRHMLCYLDIDGFRVINNNQGVQAGDRVLKQFAEFLRANLLADSSVGRLGGNEFGIILPNCPKKLGVDLAEQLRQTVESFDFDYAGNKLKVTISIGIAIISDQVDNLSELLKRSSLACMAAKEQGGNRVRVYQATNRDQARQHEMMEWLARLEQPLENLLKIRCQAITSIQPGQERSPHYEILVAIQGPEGQLLSPVPMIEAAEKYNRMNRVDRWVINSVFEWMRAHPDKVQRIHGFSINLSGNSMNDEHFLRDLLAILDANQHYNDKICFEITETAAVTNLNNVVDFIRDVKRFGCHFSLDDFGTGMSSYAYLQQLPVDYVKIDGVFIRDLLDNVKDQALVKSIAELANFMGMETIAEYVENANVLEMLRELGVNHAQGYHVGKPILISDLDG